MQLRRVAFRIGFCLSLAASAASLPLLTAQAAHPKKAHPPSGPIYQPHYSSIVIDADSGEVLHQTDPDQPSYPASLSKMMTLYILFQRLVTGKVNFDTQFTVSQHAASMEPSKLSLRPGSSVRVEDLMFGIITKSANDAAVVVAEGLAGSEAAFGVEMTQTAQRLGMRNSHFVNASGLPNPEQISTARDMATLGRALIRDFPPRYYGYFDTRSYTFKGQLLTNHNHMLGAYDGLDGIKTGFIHASGFNLVASAKRDGRRLIGAVFGGTSATGRDRTMAQLLDAAFEGRTLPEIQTASTASALRLAAARRQPVEEGDAEDQAPVKATPVKKLAPKQLAVAAKPTVQVAAKAEMPSGWAVQVGAFKGDSQARHAASQAISGDKADLAHGHVVVVKAGKGTKTMHRARIAGLTEHQAHDACRVLGHRGTACVAIGPDIQA